MQWNPANTRSCDATQKPFETMKRRFASPLGISPKSNSSDSGVCFLASSDKGLGVHSDGKKFSSPLVKSAKKSSGNDIVNLKPFQTEQLQGDSDTDVRSCSRERDSVEIPETPNARVRSTLVKKDNNRLQSRRLSKPPRPSSQVHSATALTAPRFQRVQPTGSLVSDVQKLNRTFSDGRNQSPETLSLSKYTKSRCEPSDSYSLRRSRAQLSSHIYSGAKEKSNCHSLPAGQNPCLQNQSDFIREKHEPACPGEKRTVDDESSISVGRRIGASCSLQIDVHGSQTRQSGDLDEGISNTSFTLENCMARAPQFGAGESPIDSEIHLNNSRGNHNSGATTGPVLQVLGCLPMLQLADMLLSQMGRNLAAFVASNCRKMMTDVQETKQTTPDMVTFEMISAALQKLKTLLQPSFLPFAQVLQHDIKRNDSFKTSVQILAKLYQERSEHYTSRRNIQDKELREEFKFLPTGEVKLPNGSEKRPSNAYNGTDLSIQPRRTHSSERAASSRISDESTSERLSSHDKTSNGSHLYSNGNGKFNDFLRVVSRPKSNQDLATTANKMRIDSCLQKSCLYEAQRSEFQNIWHSKQLKMAEVFKACLSQQDYLVGLLI